MLAESACVSRVVRFSRELFDAETIKKAAYRFTDRCAFDFSLESDEVVCEMRFIQPTTNAQADGLEAAFRNEALDQDLRKIVAAETEPLRNAILAYAFSDTGLQSGE